MKRDDQADGLRNMTSFKGKVPQVITLRAEKVAWVKQRLLGIVL